MFLRLGAKKSFTLIELVIVLVIVAILVSLALPRFSGVIRRAYRIEAIQILNEIRYLAWARNLECKGDPAANPPTAAWPLSWQDIGYQNPPSTKNWEFDNPPPAWKNGCKADPVIGSFFIVTAHPKPGTPADGQLDVLLTVFADGTSILQ